MSIDTLADLRPRLAAEGREDLRFLSANIDRARTPLQLRAALRSYALQAMMGTAGSLSGPDWLRVRRAAEWTREPA